MPRADVRLPPRNTQNHFRGFRVFRGYRYRSKRPDQKLNFRPGWNDLPCRSNWPAFRKFAAVTFA
jgi:hypothetical protein